MERLTLFLFIVQDLHTQFTGDDLRKIDPKFLSPRYQQYLEAVEKLDQFAQKYDKRVLHLAVRWILANVWLYIQYRGPIQHVYPPDVNNIVLYVKHFKNG